MLQAHNAQKTVGPAPSAHSGSTFSFGLLTCAIVLILVCICLLDYPLAQFISAHYSERVRFTFWALGRFGRAELWSVIAALLLLLPKLGPRLKLKYEAAQLKRAQLQGLYLALILVASTVVVWVIKAGVGRPRPALFIDQGLWRPEFFTIDSSLVSFPSGHSQVVWVGTFWLAQLFPKFRWFFFCFAPFACAGRVINLRHYPSDVVAGATIAIVCALALRRFLPQLKMS